VLEVEKGRSARDAEENIKSMAHQSPNRIHEELTIETNQSKFRRLLEDLITRCRKIKFLNDWSEPLVLSALW